MTDPKLQELNRQQVVIEADYADLFERVGKLGELIFENRKEIDEQLDRKD